MWASNFTVSMNFNVVFTTDLEAKLTSLERIMEYSNLRPEAQELRDSADDEVVQSRGSCCGDKCRRSKRSSIKFREIRGRKHTDVVTPPADWPQKGALVFSRVVLRYRPGLPAALRGLTFSVNAGDNVGVVGRTGAGKSTIAVVCAHQKPGVCLWVFNSLSSACNNELTAHAHLTTNLRLCSGFLCCSGNAEAR